MQQAGAFQVVIWWLMGGVFVLACGLVAALFLPGRGRSASVVAVATPRGASAGGQAQATHQAPPLRRMIWRHPAAWGSAVLLLMLAPAVGTWWWSQHNPRQLDGYEDTAAASDTQLTALLEGEHLIPPPPLPPDVFLTAEVAQERPLLASADRRWEQLDPQFVQNVLRIFKVMRDEHGYEMALLEGWRSPNRQAQLAAQGPQVTQAGAWQSYHQFGLAVDCAFLRDHKLVISERDPWAMQGYTLFGQVAERLGLTWGGRWKMMDFGHIEWRKPGVKLGAPPSP